MTPSFPTRRPSDLISLSLVLPGSGDKSERKPSHVADIGVAKTGGEVAMFHIYLVALVAFAVPTAAAAAPVSIVGRWKTDDGKGIVDIVDRKSTRLNSSH